MDPFQQRPTLPDCPHPPEKRSRIVITDVIPLKTRQPVKVLRSYCTACHRLIIEPAVDLTIGGDCGRN